MDKTKIVKEIDSSDFIQKIKKHAVEYAKNHATNNAKNFYVLGKKDAAVTFLTMIREDGAVAAIIDVANELIKHDPENQQAKWILENEQWKKP